MSDGLHHHQDAIADSYGPGLERFAHVRKVAILSSLEEFAELKTPFLEGLKRRGDAMRAAYDVRMLEQLVERRASLWPMLRPEDCTLEAMHAEIDAVHRGPAPWLPRDCYELVTPENAATVTERLRRPSSGTELYARLEADPIDYSRIHYGRKSIPTQPPLVLSRGWWFAFANGGLTSTERAEAVDREIWLYECRARLQAALDVDARRQVALRRRWEEALERLHFIWQHEGTAALVAALQAELASW